MEGEREWECHPLLRGSKKPDENASHGLSKATMTVLTAFCEALIPPLDVDDPNIAMKAFYQASGADHFLPDQVVGLLERFPPEAKLLIRVALLALSTRVGTLLLCGLICLSSKFPFVCSFPQLSLRKREKLMQRWSQESFFRPLRMVFLLVKTLVFHSFFSRGDENSAWHAIGYNVQEKEGHLSEGRRERPLDKGVVDVKTETEASLMTSLSEKGLKVYADDKDGVIDIECDAVIVGSGCGGVSAAVLSSAGYKVLVLEKGNYFFAGDYSGLEGPSLDNLYEAKGILSTLEGEIMILAGATVGGGSAVNFAACIKTPPPVMKEWAEEHRLPLFQSADYLSAMDVVWKRIGVTERCEEESLQNKILRRGCANLGLKVESVARNSPVRHFCGSCGMGCPTGEKHGTDTTWLVDAVERGAVILTGCEAEKFLLEQNKNKAGRKKTCVGVAACAVAGEIVRKLRIRAKVSISAGGSLRTPLLLSASGLKNRHIGKNLHLHPGIMAWGYFPEDEGTDLKGKAYEGGIITSVHTVETSDGDASRVIIETPAMGPLVFSCTMPWVSGKDMKERMLRYSRTANLVVLIRDRGAGTVKGDRRISYKSTSADKEDLRCGLRRALKILAAAGAAEVGTHQSDGQRIRCKGMTDEDLEEFLDGVRRPSGPMSGERGWGICGSAHQMGSCRMGACEEEGAVDENGESWEAQGLFVCDASLFPTALGVNPMITIQSIAVCLSNRIVAALSSVNGRTRDARREKQRWIVRESQSRVQPSGGGPDP